MSYLGILALLSLLIVIHEAGHLLAAKSVGIPIASFAVGFGPKLWARRWGRTEYSLRAFPLGGFVLPDIEEEEFRAIPLRRRLVFFFGGPLANLAAAIPLFALLNGLRGGGFSFQGTVIAPFGQLIRSCGALLAALPGMFAKPDALSGVVGIVVEGSRLAHSGRLVEVALSLTISLAVLNLLPVPVLDGGQVLLGCLEQAFPRLVRLRVPLTIMGMLALAFLMIYSNVRDVIRFWV
jgi:regulator of sigma E protease